jgi:hypothetical protein
MEIETLLRHLLPEELFKYFDLVSVKETNEKELSLYLDEKKIFPPEHTNKPDQIKIRVNFNLFCSKPPTFRAYESNVCFLWCFS